MKKSTNRILSLFLMLVLVFSMLPTFAFATSDESDYAAIINATATAYENTTDPWLIMDMARSDAKFSTTYCPTANTEAFYNAQISIIKCGTDPSKICTAIISLSALKFDAAHLDSNGAGAFINAVDTLLCLSDAAMGSNTNTFSYALLALDSGHYSDTAVGYGLTAVQTRSHLTEKLLTAQDSTTGGWAWNGGVDVDTNTTAIAITALAPYYGTTDVKAAADRALAWLQSQCQSTGFGYSVAYPTPDACSTAAMIVALLSMNLDPTLYATGSDTIDLVDALLAFQGAGGKIGSDSDSFSNEQGMRALVAYREYFPLTPTKTAVRVYDFGAHTGFTSTLASLGGGTSGTGTPEINTRAATVRVESYQATIMPKTAVTVTNRNPSLSPYGITYDYTYPSAMHSLVSAMAANGLSVSSPAFTAVGGYITVIESITPSAQGSGTGAYWSVYMNNSCSSLGAANYALTNGDNIVLYYVNCDGGWSPINQYAYFDSENKSINTGDSITLTLLDETGAAVSGAELLTSASGASSAETTTAVTTGLDGKAALTFNTAGTYLVSAQKIVRENNLISRPYCKVTVSTPHVEPAAKTVSISVTGDSSHGTILAAQNISAVPSASALAVLRSALSSSGIDIVCTGSGSAEYVSSIGGLAAYGGGPNSGWLYYVNGALPSVGCAAYIPADGDSIEFKFTGDWTVDAPVVDTNEGSSSGDDAAGSPSEKLQSFADAGSVSAWALKDMAEAVSLGIIRGDSAQKLKPDAPVTRAEFCAMLIRAMGAKVPTEYDPLYTDVSAASWYWAYIQKAGELRITNGIGGSLLNPDAPISRQDMAVMLARAFALRFEASDAAFCDMGAASAYALDGILAVSSCNLMQGDGTNFNPTATATREMAAATLVRYLRSHSSK